MRSFDDALHVAIFRNAQFFAADLFYESFAIPFPVPAENSGLSIATPVSNWRQQVAFYKWSEAHLEAVGFCNWIRYADCYLCGGLCVRANFYRRLPKDHWTACRERGGVAQIMLERAFEDLTGSIGSFGYIGDKKSYIVSMRAGYQPTQRPYIVVRWRTKLSEMQTRELVDRIAGIGQF